MVENCNMEREMSKTKDVNFFPYTFNGIGGFFFSSSWAGWEVGGKDKRKVFYALARETWTCTK